MCDPGSRVADLAQAFDLFWLTSDSETAGCAAHHDQLENEDFPISLQGHGGHLMLKVVYWNNIPAPYIVERCNVIAERGQLEFEAWFSFRNEPDRSWEIDETSWKFKYKYLPKIRISSRQIAIPIPLLRKEKPDVLVTSHYDLGFVIGWYLARLRGIKIAIRIGKTFPSWVKRSLYKEKLKRRIISRSDAIFAHGPDAIDYARTYGADQDRCMVWDQAIDVAHYSKARSVPLERRQDLRRKLGLRGIVYVYVGRMWMRLKGIGDLIDAFSTVQATLSNDVSLLLVGDGSDEVKIRDRIQERGLRNVTMTGFISKAELPEYYAASDIFVFPTIGDVYGFVVNEAMAAGLPIISTSEAGEIGQRISDGVNGFIIPPSDAGSLADAMIRMAGMKAVWGTMRDHSWELIKNQTPDKIAYDLELLCEKVMAK